MSSHEPIHSNRKVLSGSNRAFGLTFAAFFLLLAVWPWLRHGEAPRFWAIIVSCGFGALALFAERKLTPLNRLWFKLGLAIHFVMSPILMGAFFYLAITPMAFIMRAMQKDVLRLRRNVGTTYWIDRNPQGPAVGSMKKQF